MKIRVGVQIHPQHITWNDYLKYALDCEEAGVDTLWNWDHFYPLYGTPDAPMNGSLPPDWNPPAETSGWHFEGWTTLTALGALTRRVEVGCLVTCNSYRNPQLLADMARTLDHITGGRAILGIGSGWFEKDYTEYGFEFGTAISRLKGLGANLPIIEERLAKLLPQPNRKIPILIGGGGEKVTLKLVAKHADMWNGFGPPEEFARKSAILDQHCADVGRDPKAIERTVLVPPTSLGSLDEFVKAGATHIILQQGAPFQFDAVKALVAWRDKV